jgi:glutamate racemase
MMASMQTPSVGPDPRTRPIAVFDSGVGGLTVLHELLVRLPCEDFLYLGDTARFPYGERSRAELERFAAEIAEELLRRRAKLLVVACNSLTSAAMPSLVARMRQTTLGIDVLGVVTPEALRAVAATRSGRVGLLATPTTVASGAYERAVTAIDPHVTLHAVACPTLASIIQDGRQFDEQAVATVREACQPLRTAGVDTVILGCTHYPLIGQMLQRMLGPDVTLVTSGAALARQVEHALGTRNLRRTGGQVATWEDDFRQPGGPASGRARPQGSAETGEAAFPGQVGEYGQGDYRFLCTGDVDAFRELGTRFLQMPMTAVEHVRLEPVEAVA